MTPRILVWDLPTRLFHWTLALSFAVAYLTGESERWASLHVTAGYTLLGLIGFRLVWGLVGSRYARFAQFVTGFASLRRYVTELARGRPTRYLGHNPAGALAILALLLLGLASGVSGWMLDAKSGGEWLEELHETVSALMLAMVVAHIAGVLISSRLHGENLVRSMITGMKQGEAGQAISGGRPLVAALLLLALAGFWSWSYTGAAAGPDEVAWSATSLADGDADDDD